MANILPGSKKKKKSKYVYEAVIQDKWKQVYSKWNKITW